MEIMQKLKCASAYSFIWKSTICVIILISDGSGFAWQALQTQ